MQPVGGAAATTGMLAAGAVDESEHAASNAPDETTNAHAARKEYDINEVCESE